jgi:tetratricopeptide (TPR) repeat protein
MDERMYRILMTVAIVLTVTWVGWSAYDGFWGNRHPGDLAYHAGNNAFEDGQYVKALKDYDQALREDPRHLWALRGKARALMQLQRDDEALRTFSRAIRAEPDFAAAYANRGILLDRMGRYQAAIRDYEHALQLDPSLADGPGWLTRFLRLQPQKPPTIADRARYLRAEFRKPARERKLRMPKQDAKQRPYKM